MTQRYREETLSSTRLNSIAPAESQVNKNYRLTYYNYLFKPYVEKITLMCNDTGVLFQYNILFSCSFRPKIYVFSYIFNMLLLLVKLKDKNYDDKSSLDQPFSRWRIAPRPSTGSMKIMFNEHNVLYV